MRKVKIKFNGMIEKSKKGCKVCGKRKTDTAFLQHKSFMLPSGRRMTFFAGVTYEVSYSDAEFLKNVTYMQGGQEKHSFEVL